VIGALTRLLGRLPIGLLQLLHNRNRLLAAIAGVAFADMLVFVQLGLSGSLTEAVQRQYRLFDADLLLLSAADSDGLEEGSNVPRARLYQALAHPDVADGAPLWVGRVVWNTDEGDTAALGAFALDPQHRHLLRDDLEPLFEPLTLLDTVVTDRDTRFLDMSRFDTASPDTPIPFELQGRRVQAVGTFGLGGGFAGDGGLLASEQTFFRLLPRRSSAAPSHVLLRVAPGADAERVGAELTAELGPDQVTVRPIRTAMATAAEVQLRERPTGIIFAFGVLIGVTVGIVIAYQVLATDVADHLGEYATFKAMGYPQSFFVGIILEEALILGVLGFIPGLGLAMAFYDGLAMRAGVPLFMTVDRAVVVFVGTLVACSLSGVLAMRRLAAADPADLF